MMKNKKITYIALLSALAIVFGYIESLFPVLIAIPGIKLGLSNLVVLFSLYFLDKPSAFFIMLIKVLVTSLLFSGFNMFFYSINGGILSLGAMILFKKHNFSIYGISMAGGVFHNIGQLLVAGIMLGTSSVSYYFPILLLSGLFVGYIIGAVCKVIISRFNNLAF